MSEERKPRFLQQTTSQLLHQQEALQRRREMLEKAGAKLPVMRFGTAPTTPPRSSSRPGRSPPPTATPTGRQASHSVSSSARGQRELNWKRSGDVVASNRGPMRFSLAYRPAPTPATNLRRSPVSGYKRSNSPAPRCVGHTTRAVCGRKSSIETDSRERRIYTSNTSSPRSPERRRICTENQVGLDESRKGEAELQPWTPPPLHGCHSQDDGTPKGAAALSFTQPSVAAPSTDGKAILTPGVGIGEFPLPRFSATSPVATTPIRCTSRPPTSRSPVPSEFPTPLPVTRLSVTLQQSMLDSSPPPSFSRTETESAQQAKDAYASMEGSIEFTRGAQRLPPEEGVVESDSPTRDIRVSPSFSRVNKSCSPAPTTEGLIQSVQASAEKRACGCDRPLSSLDTWHECPKSPGAMSPPPTPVSQVELLSKQTTQRRGDRPTPASMSSPAAGGAPNVKQPSPSPWPTTDNIIDSIIASSKRGNVEHAANGEAEETIRNESTKADRGVALSHAMDHLTKTPSPMPTDQHYDQSFATSVVKLRCANKTPSLRDPPDGNIAPVAPYSPSPQTSAQQLLGSLCVSIETQADRGKPYDRQTSESTLVGTFTMNEVQAALRRTVSPIPTTEQIQMSMDASADKRRPGLSVSMSSAPPLASVSPRKAILRRSFSNEDAVNFPSSPTLTPQNIKDSVEKVLDEMQQHQQQTRSDAPDPQRPWLELSCDERSKQAISSAALESSASPILTADDVDTSLLALQRDGRDCRPDRCHNSSFSPDGLQKVRVESHSAAPVQHCCDEPTAGGVATAKTAEEAPLHRVPSITSPALSDFCLNSAMFGECISAPPTPAFEPPPPLPQLSVVPAATSVFIAPEFLDLQREVQAISRGQSRTPTPAPICETEDCAAAPKNDPPANGEDAPKCQKDEDAVEDITAGRRSSLILVYPTVGNQPCLQQPHQPIATPSPPAMCALQIPRTPTPPPRPPLPFPITGVRREETPLPRVPQDRSPLPRPVSLRSQVSVPKPPSARHNRSSSFRENDQVSDGGVRGPAQPSSGDVRSTSQLTAEKVAEVGLLHPSNSWMDLVEPLQQIVAVSLHSDSVVHGTYPGCGEPASLRKRSRSRVVGEEQSQPRVTIATPMSLTLSVGEAVADEVSRGTATPLCLGEHTPRPSTRGRRSEAEKLMEMLPDDVAQLVANSISADDSTPSVSQGSRRSGRSTGDEASVERSSTSSRRVPYDYDSYVAYLEDLARSSAKKARRKAGERMQQRFVKDAKKHGALQEDVSEEGGVALSEVRGTVQAALRDVLRKNSSSPDGTPGDAFFSPSPLSSSSIQRDRPTTLKVSTRLSAELREALFRHPSLENEESAESSSRSDSTTSQTVVPPAPPPALVKVARSPPRKRGGEAGNTHKATAVGGKRGGRKGKRAQTLPPVPPPQPPPIETRPTPTVLPPNVKCAVPASRQRGKPLRVTASKTKKLLRTAKASRVVKRMKRKRS